MAVLATACKIGFTTTPRQGKEHSHLLWQQQCFRRSQRQRLMHHPAYSVCRNMHKCTAAKNICSLLAAFATPETTTGEDVMPTKLQQHSASDGRKLVWVQTANKAVFTAACEAGLSTFVFDPDSRGLVAEWQELARFEALEISAAGRISGGNDAQVGRLMKISSREDVESAAKLASGPGYVVMDCSDWQSIPAENLVASFMGSPAVLLATATSLDDACIKLQALESGTAGVLLRTDDPAEVRALAQYVMQAAATSAEHLKFEVATVSSVRSIGMGHRVCVDLCSLLVPGEGLLTGNFAAALFLVHSECTESKYINSRPFRVNAGPVHAYVHCPGGRTAYLSELRSGSEVVVVDAAGSQRTAIVGRVKIETRPLVLVEAETSDGQRHSIMLQNAETVRLVGPSRRVAVGGENNEAQLQKDGINASEQQGSQGIVQGWQTASVSQLVAGDLAYVLCQAGARHTGIRIVENCTER